MLGRFLRQRLANLFLEHCPVCPGPERRFEVHFQMIAQAGAQFSVASQAYLVAAFSEVEIAQGANQALCHLAALQTKVAGRSKSQWLRDLFGKTTTSNVIMVEREQ